MMSPNEFNNAMMERYKQTNDPVKARHLSALVTKLQEIISEAVEGEKRGRSLIIYGIPESDPSLPPSARQSEVEKRLARYDCVSAGCRPVELYCVGKPDVSRSPLVKLVLSSGNDYIKALSNSYRLRSSGLSSNYIRKSLTPTERKHGYELRQECKARNKQEMAAIEWYTAAS